MSSQNKAQQAKAAAPAKCVATCVLLLISLISLISLDPQVNRAGKVRPEDGGPKKDRAKTADEAGSGATTREDGESELEVRTASCPSCLYSLADWVIFADPQAEAEAEAAAQEGGQGQEGRSDRARRRRACRRAGRGIGGERLQRMFLFLLCADCVLRLACEAQKGG